MDIVFEIEVVGGPFDGAPGLGWIDDGENEPPPAIRVGVCAKGAWCGAAACKRGRARHVSFWTPDEDGIPRAAVEYARQDVVVVRDAANGLAGRAVYAIGGLLNPQSFGRFAEAPTAAGGVHARAFDSPEALFEHYRRQAAA